MLEPKLIVLLFIWAHEQSEERMNVKTQRRILVTAIVTKQERSMGNNQDRKDLKSKK